MRTVLIGPSGRCATYLTLKGSNLWPYIAGTIPKPDTTEIKKWVKWEEGDVQALSTILMNITLNVQARLDCSSAKAAWDSLI